VATIASSVTTDSSSFRFACSRFATGVTVVTSLRPDATPVGMTVSSFTPVSLEPALVLVCLQRSCSIFNDLVEFGRFGLNILASHQQALSIRFSARDTERFEGIEWRRGANGVPLLSGVLATMECDLDQVYACGDHQILIGKVSDISTHVGAPLIRFSSAYHSLERGSLSHFFERP